MPDSDIDQKNTRLEQELINRRQTAFASELFQDDITVRTLLESLAEGVVIIDASGTILLVNDAAERMFGYQRNELIGKPQAILIPDRFRKVHEKHQAQFIAVPGTRQTGQLRDLTGRRQDGSEFPVGISLSHIETINGVLVMALISDITGRKMAQEALRESENKFSKAFQATPSVLVIASLADGKYLEVNEAFEGVMGYRRDKVIGRTALEINIWQNLEDRGKVIRLLTEGKKVRNLEIGFKSSSGTIIVGLYSAEIIEIGDEQFLLSLVNDITARKKAEEELRHNEERYRRLYNDTPVMLHSIDHDGRLLSVSNYWLETLGYERSEVLGRISTEFLTAESRSYATEVVLPEFFRSGSCKEVPYQFVKKSGEILDVLLSAIAERDSHDRVVSSLAVMVDVTERKRAEEKIERLSTDLAERAAELEAANRELEAFNYTVAHDLRKPLTVVNGYCQVIRDLCGNNLTEQCRGYLQGAYDGTWRMNQLIDALLNFSRLSHVEPHRGTVDLSAMAHEVATELQLSEPERRVTFLIANGISADGDEALLRVVLNNLLGNAWKYTGMRAEGIIEFGTTAVAGKPAFFVRDNGPGFDMANADHIFTPFQRLPGAEECRGFGIGLATVERIIRRHRGQVWAEGEPGKGATFYFTLSAEEGSH